MGKSVGEFVKRFPNLQAEEIKNVLRGVGLLVDYQLHEHSLTLKVVELEALKGPSAAVTAVEQSSGHRERIVSKKLAEIAVGDFVLRWFVGIPKPMRLKVTQLTADRIICGGWEFDRQSGAEMDQVSRLGPWWCHRFIS